MYWSKEKEKSNRRTSPYEPGKSAKQNMTPHFGKLNVQKTILQVKEFFLSVKNF